MQTENPYKAPPEATEDSSPAADPILKGGRGPAVPIAFLTLIGGLCGMPLLIQENIMGFLGSMPGAIAGAIYYRFRSSKWPINPTAKRRRYTYALIATLALPLITASVTGMRAQGFTMTILALWVGASVGIGILLSGDRRSVKED